MLKFGDSKKSEDNPASFGRDFRRFLRVERIICDFEFSDVAAHYPARPGYALARLSACPYFCRFPSRRLSMRQKKAPHQRGQGFGPWAVTGKGLPEEKPASNQRHPFALMKLLRTAAQPSASASEMARPKKPVIVPSVSWKEQLGDMKLEGISTIAKLVLDRVFWDAITYSGLVEHVFGDGIAASSSSVDQHEQEAVGGCGLVLDAPESRQGISGSPGCRLDS